MKKKWLSVVAAAETKPAEISIDGPIGSSWWDDSGTSSQEFTDALNSIPAGTKINLRVNSQGGSVKDGLKMYHAIAARRDDVTSVIEGYAVSIASLFPLAAGKVVSPLGSIWMIHDPLGQTQGNEADHLKSAEMLKAHAVEMADIYARHTGKTATEARVAMQKETWMTSEEAVAFGLASEAPEADADAPLAALDVSKFTNVPSNLLTLVSNGRQPKQPKQTALAIAGAQSTIMNKAKIVALLKKRGNADASESWTDDQLMAALEKTETPVVAVAPVPAGVVSLAEHNELKGQIKAERAQRVTAEVMRRAENKISNDKIAWWVAQALADEAGTLAQIDAMAVNSPGGSAVGNVIILAENPLEKILKANPNEGTPLARFRAATARRSSMKADWKGLLDDAYARDSRRSVVAANTYSASLVTQFLIDGATTQLQNRWAALKCFSRDNSTDPFKPRATGQYKFVTGGGTTQKNAANFESGDSTVSNVSVSVDQYSQAFHVTNDELNSGLRMENLVDINLALLADQITSVALAPITAANFPGLGNPNLPAIVRSPDLFSFSDMRIGWGRLKKSPIHNAVLDGEYLAGIINVPTQFQKSGVEPGNEWAAFGWDNVALGTNWSGADANVRGFLCNPQAIATISGRPLTAPVVPGNTIQESTTMIPGVDVVLSVYFWFSLATRTAWCSYDLMFGASLLDPTAGLIIKSQ